MGAFGNLRFVLSHLIYTGQNAKNIANGPLQKASILSRKNIGCFLSI